MAQDKPDLGPIFLSASIPDPKRDPSYSQGVDVIAICEAICALAEVVLPRQALHFGGHPAISPLIGMVARALDQSESTPGGGHFDAVTIYQSEFFRRDVPSSSLAFPRIQWTPNVGNDREESLERMRRRMLDPSLHGPAYSAAFFVGGMEGIEAEFDLFRKLQPHAAFWPIASTKGAAAKLYSAFEADVLSQPAAQQLGPHRTHELLESTVTYRQCFRDLLSAI